MALTVMSYSPSSRAVARVRPITPAFATEYGVLEKVPPPRCAETEEMFTMRPILFFTMDSATRRVA